MWYYYIMPEQADYTQKELLDSILHNAIQSRASDIHLDSERDGFLIRYRIDGILHVIDTLSKQFQDEIISRIKVLAEMDITEHRIPQDGHIGWENYNFRVSIFPSIHGEAIVLRLLKEESALLQLEELGSDEEQLEVLKLLIHRPYGIILITGPSNSGKTTLLYAILNALNKPSNNIITVEDPVELQMGGIRQAQINEHIGLTFSKVMRAILRQDPDVIMLGEIRDDDTLHMAAQAALSGRLVFSTFHTFDVPALVLRLVEMGIPKSIIGHTLLGVVSRRLIRIICSSCKEPHTLTALERGVVGDKGGSYSFQQGKGCSACFKTGYSGRIGIFEIVPFDDEIQAHILENKPISGLGELINKKGIKTLRDSAIEKAQQGITTVEEVMRVIGV